MKTFDRKMQKELVFEQNYFNDNEEKLSNYLDYRTRDYDGLCKTLITECGIQKYDRIVDYGCATGALLLAFKKNAYRNIVGTDISYYAIGYGKNSLGLEKELQYYNRNLLVEDKDWLIMLDILEHIPTQQELRLTMHLIGKSTVRKGIIIRVPVSPMEGSDFYLDVSNKDETHYQKHTKTWWLNLFESCGLQLVKYFNSEPYIWDSPGVLALLLERRDY